MKAEAIARWLLILLLPVLLLAALLLRSQGSSQAVELRARMPEQGGWTPTDMIMSAGQPLLLRLTSDDVLHGFAIGQSDEPAVDVFPGKMTELTLLFDQPGKYTYYCTRWCGANHWRMRGTIEVLPNPDQPDPTQVDVPNEESLFMRLGVELDGHPHTDLVPEQGRPDAHRAAALGIAPPESYLVPEYYRTHSPVEVFTALRREPFSASLSDQQVWDFVAWIWQQGTSSEKLAEGQELYTRNCAACHGTSGAGDGVMAAQVAAEYANSGHQSGPTNFTNPQRSLATSPAIQQGKIIRGGMGTGMPYWGPIFTEEQIWSLVDYLWTFQFDY